MRNALRHGAEFLLLAAAALAGRGTIAGVLPEERADTLYHYYDGGGVQIKGPSILVRKSVGESLSVSGSWYVDNVSSASIDVVTTASPYKEERKQWGGGLTYLHDDTTMTADYANSEENDYTAKTLNLGISQEIFGGLTTVSLGYGSGQDDISRVGDPTFAETADRHAYRVGLSQVVTRNLLMGFSYEAIADEGYLNNPYRQVRYVDSSTSKGYAYQPEVYPQTHTSNAAAIRGRYYLPYRAAVSGEYRFYSDDWGVNASTVDIGYTQPWREAWTFDVRYRYYTQSGADFYSDLFPYENAQNFLARDKELSKFWSHGPHLGVAYTMFDTKGDWPVRGTVNGAIDVIFYNYDDFRDLEDSAPVGQEPLYSFSATVWQAFVSIWF